MNPLKTVLGLCKRFCSFSRGELRPGQTRQLPRAVDLKGAASELSKLLIK